MKWIYIINYWYLEAKEFGLISQTTGYIKWFNKKKGFGLISQENESKDLSFHVSSSVCKDVCEFFKGEKIT
ncbi:MAG: cold-shock protein, partial [Flavobacteriales bacterium]|nr:cold-shock protein [Flavobacteriales bacterium]